MVLPLLAAAGIAYGGLNHVAPRRKTFVTLGCAAELIPQPGADGGSQSSRTVASVSRSPYQAIPADAAIVAAAAAAHTAPYQ